MIDNRLIMEKIVWGNIFSIEIPQTWSMDQDDGLIAFFDELNGVGALQISIAKREISQAPTEDGAKMIAVDYAVQKGWNIGNTLNIYWISNSVLSEFSILDDQDGELNYWRIWHAIGEERMAFATYNCSASDKLEEEKLCGSVMRSLKWL